jgi:hypothetical protein
MTSYQGRVLVKKRAPGLQGGNENRETNKEE